MKEKKTTKRLLPMMAKYELRDQLDDDGMMTLMRRRRDGGLSEKTNPWEDFDEEKEGINTQLYIYEMRTGPQLRLQGKRVIAYNQDGEELDSRPLEYVRTVCLLARKWKTKGETECLLIANDEDTLKVATEGEIKMVQKNEPSFEVQLFPSGKVMVGCQPFPWEEIDAFAKKMGWWK